MIDGAHPVEFADVRVLRANDLVMLCWVGSRLVEVAPQHILPGTTVSGQGDRGRLVLPRELAITLGLIWKPG
jgi:hypothetical protein